MRSDLAANALLAANDRIVEYLPVLVLLLFATGFAALNLVLSWLAGTKGQKNPVKDAAYECGLPAITDAHAQFSVKFYLVALLFVLFDIEVVFLPLGGVLPDPGTAGLPLHGDGRLRGHPLLRMVVRDAQGRRGLVVRVSRSRGPR